MFLIVYAQTTMIYFVNEVLVHRLEHLVAESISNDIT